ncbi:MAG: LytTR family transcriptional regulator DNA-binding domain-containing protein [Bacteroidota bacterium]
MESIKVLIIEDEELARNLLKTLLAEFEELEIIGECSDGFSGAKAINELKPDLIFLDVQMPKLTGFELLELIDHKPEVIFTTAYDEFALKAFEMNAVDYLLKPFSNSRLAQSIKKAAEKIYSKEKQEPKSIESLKTYIETENTKILDRILIKKNSQIIVVPADHVKYIEAQDDYVMIYATEGRFLKQKTMSFFEEHLNPSRFVRIHRSFIVQISEIDKIELYEKDSYLVLLKDGTKLKASKTGYKKLKEML